MCEWGNDTPVLVTISARLSRNRKAYQRIVGIDSCIASIVDALNKGGVTTEQSCCGHGKWPGRIDLVDGRVLMIVSEKEADDAINARVATSEARRLIDETLEKLDPEKDGDSWFAVRLTKIAEALFDLHAKHAQPADAAKEMLCPRCRCTHYGKEPSESEDLIDPETGMSPRQAAWKLARPGANVDDLLRSEWDCGWVFATDCPKLPISEAPPEYQTMSRWHARPSSDAGLTVEKIAKAMLRMKHEDSLNLEAAIRNLRTYCGSNAARAVGEMFLAALAEQEDKDANVPA